MKLSFTTMATPGFGHERAIALALKHGFQGVDLRCHDDQAELSLDSTNEQLDQIACDFRAAGLSIPSLLCYNTIDATSATLHRTLTDETQRLLEVAVRLGAEAIRLFGGDLAACDEPEFVLGIMADAFAEVLDRNPDGPHIYLQNHKPSFTTRCAIDLASRIDRSRFGLVFSPDHSVMMEEEDMAELLPSVLPWTRELYLSDVANIDGDAVLPGAGIVPFDDVFRFFQDNDFAGYYAFKWEKIWQAELPDANVALPAFVEFMCQS